LKSGAEAASLFADAISPKVGLVWRMNPNLTFTAQCNTGFRAPQYNEINSGFTNLVSPFFRYRTLSNPNLRPETSQGFEVGLRGIYPQASFSLAAYYNTYNDFIEAFREVGSEPSPPGPPGSPPPPPVILFQSQNVSRARIYGVEATGQYFFSPDLTGWSLNGSFAWAVGDNLTEGKPLLSIEPLTAVLGLHYDDPSQIWGARLVATLVADPRDPQRQPTRPNPNAPPGSRLCPGATPWWTCWATTTWTTTGSSILGCSISSTRSIFSTPKPAPSLSALKWNGGPSRDGMLRSVFPPGFRGQDLGLCLLWILL